MFNRPIIGKSVATALAALLLAIPGLALAAPGDSDTDTGSAQASILEPIDIQKVADLRFGRIMQPVTAGTITITPEGAVSTTGGVTGNIDTPQTFPGRGPGAFGVFGEENRRFHTFVDNTITLSNGTSTMIVSKVDDNAGPPGFSTTDADGYFALLVGGTLEVAANQEPGTYSGEYDVRVLYH